MHFLKEIDSPSPWSHSTGSHHTKVVGEVPRFRCTHCGRSFSERSFDIDYYAKKVDPYREVFLRNNSGECAIAMT